MASCRKVLRSLVTTRGGRVASSKKGPEMQVVASSRKVPEIEFAKGVKVDLDFGLVGEAEAGNAGEQPAKE